MNVRIHVSIFVYMYVIEYDVFRMCVCMYVYMDVFVELYIHICMSVFIYLCMSSKITNLSKLTFPH